MGEIRRLEEMQRRCRFFHAQITETSPPVGMTPLSAIPPFTSTGPRAPQAFDELDEKLSDHETRLNQINSSYEVLGKRQRELEEARCVLRETAGFFSQQTGNRHIEIRSSFGDGDGSSPLLDNAAEYGTLPGESSFNGVDLEFVAGTIERTRMPIFERVLWRVLRGNLYMNYSEIEEPFIDPTNGKETYKDVFIIFSHGAELLTKIRKVAESMGGTLYPIDADPDKRADAERDVTSRLEDVNSVLSKRAKLDVSSSARLLSSCNLGKTPPPRRSSSIKR